MSAMKSLFYKIIDALEVKNGKEEVEFFVTKTWITTIQGRCAVGFEAHDSLPADCTQEIRFIALHALVSYS